MVLIVIFKYREDIGLVLTGKGDIPYDKSLVDDLQIVRLKTVLKELYVVLDETKRDGLPTRQLEETIKLYEDFI